jgi:hypothetical protein
VAPAARRPVYAARCGEPYPGTPWIACRLKRGHADEPNPSNHFVAGLWWSAPRAATVTPTPDDGTATSPLF